VLPWWAWVILVLLLLAWILIYAGISWRRGIRREFIEYLKKHYPGLVVAEENVAYLRLEGPTMDLGVVSMGGLYHAVSQAEVRTPQDRQEVYEKFLKMLKEGVSLMSRKLTREEDAGRIMPRLVTREFFATEPLLAGAPNVPLGNTGLYVVYVLDGDASVVYLTRDHLADLGMSDQEVGTLALEHLKRSAPLENLVREAVEHGSVVSVKQLDTYDAARLLLLPDLLQEGEALVAAVPDRDTLVFLKEPPGGRVEEIQGLLLSTSDKPLLKKALRVTNRGIE
jgi:hypothetical protein